MNRTHIKRLPAERVFIEQNEPKQAKDRNEFDAISEEIAEEFCSLEVVKNYDVMRFLTPRETIVLNSMKTCKTYDFAGTKQVIVDGLSSWRDILIPRKFTLVTEIDVPRFEFDAEYLEDKLQQKLLHTHIKIKKNG